MSPELPKEEVEYTPTLIADLAYEAFTREQVTEKAVALDKIYQHLGQYTDISLSQTPRYNQKVNDLIFYAHSGGDWKNEYVTSAKAIGRDWTKDGIFEPDLVHFSGDFKLNIPSERAVTTEKYKTDKDIFRNTVRSKEDLSATDQKALEDLRRQMGLIE